MSLFSFFPHFFHFLIDHCFDFRLHHQLLRHPLPNKIWDTFDGFLLWLQKTKKATGVGIDDGALSTGLADFSHEKSKGALALALDKAEPAAIIIVGRAGRGVPAQCWGQKNSGAGVFDIAWLSGLLCKAWHLSSHCFPFFNHFSHRVFHSTS